MRRRSRGQSDGSRVAGSLAAGVVLLAVAGLVAEGAARIAFPRWKEFNADRVQDKTDIAGLGAVTIGRAGFDGWIAQPNGDFRTHIQINAAGWRADEPAEAADGRLWVLGESFAFGWGVEAEETFGAVAARTLGLPVYGVASPAADLAVDRALLARMPATVHPRAVVLGLSVETDLRDYDHAVTAEPPRTLATRLHDARETVAKRSALYTLVSQLVARVDGSNNAPAAAPVAALPQTVDEGRIAAILESSLARIGQIRAALPAEVPLVVLVIPARDDVRTGDATYRALRLGVVERLTAQGIAVVDPFDALAAVGEAKVHFPHDGHWSAQGHRLAGEALARTLAPLVPAPAPAAIPVVVPVPVAAPVAAPAPAPAPVEAPAAPVTAPAPVVTPAPAAAPAPDAKP
ncbi:alginate O-acetyltransferase AlgX-related protein [Magnetospirillum fulvum]|uniref:alginate O-acetyltransferase AlgX-related protein n=1 Tax=Magnetospirillum fulvum TaxID=1082 RepID=UPI001B8C5C82|nr:hypothetical protein [Magnetospirillum fulvum]